MEKTYSKYARKFNSLSSVWSKDKEYNIMYLKTMQAHYTSLLRARKYVFLRDVYEALGIPITRDSIIVGWHFDLENNFGDNFVDIQIHELDDGTFMLDFNVDGDITSFIPN